MFAGRDPNPQRVAIMNTDTVGSHIGPFFVRVFHNNQAAGADITAAIMLVPARRGKLEQVDLVAAFNVFGYRPMRNFYWLERFVRSELLLPSLNHLHAAQRRIQAERKSGRCRRADSV